MGMVLKISGLWGSKPKTEERVEPAPAGFDYRMALAFPGYDCGIELEKIIARPTRRLSVKDLDAEPTSPAYAVFFSYMQNQEIGSQIGSQLWFEGLTTEYERLDVTTKATGLTNVVLQPASTYHIGAQQVTVFLSTKEGTHLDDEILPESVFRSAMEDGLQQSVALMYTILKDQFASEKNADFYVGIVCSNKKPEGSE